MSRAIKPNELVFIVDVDHQGRGVARINGKACFVPGALAGEQVMIRRIKRLARFDEAELVEVVQASEQRIAPQCAHFGRCGGCTWQHISHADQLQLKQAALARELSQNGPGAPLRWDEPLSARPWNYRRKARFGVKQLPKSGRAIIGFRERSSNLLANVRNCVVMAEPLNHLVDPLGELIGGLSIAARVPQLEVAVSEGRALLVMRVLDPPNDDDIEKLKQFEKIHQIEFALQPKGPETVTDLDGAPLNPLRYTLTDFGITFEFTPLDFIQVNAPMNERLVASAIHALQCESHHQVLDVFCGLGNFTLPIAKHVKSVIGVEGDATLVERAKSTAKRHVITNAEFFMADCFKLVGQESWLKRPVDRLLLDPPRAGAKELIPWIPQLNPQRIVYVSCHPGTLARDLKMLNEVGYELQSVGIVDMFSHTSHIESMAVLVRR